jgi:hypothetical protein
MPEPFTLQSILDSPADQFASATTHARGPEGQLPITTEMLLTAPSGNLFGLSQNAGMGWEPQRLLDPEFLILSTHGGLRAADGTPIALGFHTGHWEVGLLVAEAASFATCTPRPSRAPSPTHATAAPKAPPACSIRCPTATMPPWCCAA